MLAPAYLCSLTKPLCTTKRTLGVEALEARAYEIESGDSFMLCSSASLSRTVHRAGAIVRRVVAEQSNAGGEAKPRILSQLGCLCPSRSRPSPFKMHLMYHSQPDGTRLYTLKKVEPGTGRISKSAHPGQSSAPTLRFGFLGARAAS